MRARDLLSFGQEALKSAGIFDWDYDSRILMEWCCQISRTDLIMEPSLEVSDEKIEQYKYYIGKRTAHEPLQYLMGECEFMGLPFEVNPSVLIPRQDTEVLVEWILDREKIHCQNEREVLDVCTGSGCIAISLDVLWKARGYVPLNTDALDISLEALETARKNNILNHANVTFHHSNMFERIDGKYDMIVSNPPYIPSGVIESLMKEVTEHEPRLALDGKKDGLYFYRILAREGKKHLKDGGVLYLEIGHDQGRTVPELLHAEGFTKIEVKKDLAGNDRCVRAEFHIIS